MNIGTGGARMCAWPLLLLAPVASAQGLVWSVRLIPATRPQIEVVVDTSKLKSNEVVDAATFNARFFNPSKNLLGAKNFSIVDTRLFILEAGTIYRRYYYAPYASSRSLVAENLNFRVRTLGDKEDGQGDELQPPRSQPCCTPPSGQPTVEILPEPVALPSLVKTVGTAHVPAGARAAAVVVGATRESRCAAYSRLAVAQNQTNKLRSCHAQDSRWSSDFSHHNGYCLQVGPENARPESETRQRILTECLR